MSEHEAMRCAKKCTGIKLWILTAALTVLHVYHLGKTFPGVLTFSPVGLNRLNRMSSQVPSCSKEGWVSGYFGGYRNKEALPLPGAQFSYLVTLGLYIYKNAYILIHCFEILLHCWLVRCIHGAISHLLLWSLVYKMRLPWTYILNEELSFPALLAPSLWRNSNYLLKHLL